MTQCICPTCGQEIFGWTFHGQIIVGIKTVSEANRRGAWQVHVKREKSQRSTMAIVMRAIKDVPRRSKAMVRITRIAPRMLDKDNLAGALKHVRDGIADWLGGKGDRESDLLYWLVDQRKGKTGENAVHVEVFVQ